MVCPHATASSSLKSKSSHVTPQLKILTSAFKIKPKLLDMPPNLSSAYMVNALLCHFQPLNCSTERLCSTLTKPLLISTHIMSLASSPWHTFFLVPRIPFQMLFT